MIGGKSASWSEVDGEVAGKLAGIAAKGGKIRILSSTVNSPSTLKVIGDFATKFPTAKHIQYDAVSASAMRQANMESFGVNAIPSYSLDKAEVIVSLGADFLVNWISPVEHSKQYAATRKLDDGKKSMSRHIQFESALSVTGSNADQRVTVKPSQQMAVATALYNAVAAKSGATPVASSASGELQKTVNTVAEELLSGKGKSVVLCGINNVALQNVVNGINALLGNYGSTIDLDNYSNLRNGSDADMAGLMDELSKGEVAALLVYNCNPVYTHPKGADIAKAMKSIELTVAFSDRPDETASMCGYNCPDLHQLESWNDFEPRHGAYSLSQPTISPLFDARQMQESLMNWSGNPGNYHDYLRERQDFKEGNCSKACMS
jgi:molybdopterin-containing oxidoreductase family iron-sulfur binding subunit